MHLSYRTNQNRGIDEIAFIIQTIFTSIQSLQKSILSKKNIIKIEHHNYLNHDKTTNNIIIY